MPSCELMEDCFNEWAITACLRYCRASDNMS